jgi:hydroxymethylbilane synthase
VFSPAHVLPAPAQGAIAIQTRLDDHDLNARLAALDHAPTHRAVEAERELLHQLRGGCSVPVGALAYVTAGHVRIEAGVFALAGSPAYRVQAQGGSPAAVGADAARALLALGAGAILEALDRVPRVAVERPA